MKYIKMLISTLSVALVSTVVYAAPSTNLPLVASSELSPWTLSVSGGGSSALVNDKNSVVGTQFQVGYLSKFVLPVEFGLRQNIGYSGGNGSSWVCSTKIYSDWTVLKLGNFQVDGGVNVGPAYGNTTLTWTISPEVVTRLYLTKTVDLFGRVEYPYNLNVGATANRLDYVIGLRVRF
jgi:hypothetical protein